MENLDAWDEPELSMLRFLCVHRVELVWDGSVYCAQCGLFIRASQ